MLPTKSEEENGHEKGSSTDLLSVISKVSAPKSSLLKTTEVSLNTTILEKVTDSKETNEPIEVSKFDLKIPDKPMDEAINISTDAPVFDLFLKHQLSLQFKM